MFAEWINDNYFLKATIELSSHLNDLEVKLAIWLGKGQLPESPGKPEWAALMWVPC